MQAQQHGDLSTMPAANLTSGRVQTMFEGKDQEGRNHTNPEELEDFNEMAALLESSTTPINIKRGDVVDGVIVRIDQDEILVDIGLKSEGVLSTKELPATGDWSFDQLHLNDKVLVYVIQPETPDGHALLSLKRANAEQQWRIAEDQYKNGELLKARVIDYNKGGLIVDVSGIRGFVPISQILNLKREEVAAGGNNQETAAKLQSMKDKELQLKIIEINRARNRLILSERLAVQEWRQRRREELLDELKPNEVRRGVVSNLANFGAFVDLGGADGLVHISQLAWSRVNHPSEVLKVGQEVEVQVLSVDKDKKKIALSIKRAEVDPWTTVEQRYTPGQVVTGVVTKIAPFGAFARIEDGIEGLIHQSELTPGMDPKANLHEGQQLQLRILRIDAERRRLGLSLRQAEEPNYVEEVIKLLLKSEDPTEMAEIIADVAIDTLPEATAIVVHQCVILHWFDEPIIEALLQDAHIRTKAQIRDIYEQIINLSFIEHLLWGYAFQDLTREGLLKRLAITKPELLRSAASLATSAYLSQADYRVQAEAVFCMIISGDKQKADDLSDELTKQADDPQFTSNLRDLTNEAHQVRDIVTNDVMTAGENIFSREKSLEEKKMERRERRVRAERSSENPLFNNLSVGDEEETTAMAEAFRAAARQRSKEESELGNES
jgi:small subunit ribosomal protein S1